MLQKMCILTALSRIQFRFILYMTPTNRYGRTHSKQFYISNTEFIKIRYNCFNINGHPTIGIRCEIDFKVLSEIISVSSK